MARKREFGSNWWARRWIEVLESFGWDDRLQRGRGYARSGRVRSIDVAGSEVTARVQGTMPRPYRVSIKVKPLSAEQWRSLLDGMASQAVFAAKLLAGEMPPDIEKLFDEVGVPLFPSSERDLETRCSCPDWVNPCKHVAAVHYLLGAEFDKDPFLLLQLRGLSREQILNELRSLRTGGETAEPAPPVPAPPQEAGPQIDPEQFWILGEELSAPYSPPAKHLPEGVMKLLGSPPFFGDHIEPLLALFQAYDRIEKRAKGLAYDVV